MNEIISIILFVLSSSALYIPFFVIEKSYNKWYEGPTVIMGWTLGLTIFVCGFINMIKILLPV